MRENGGTMGRSTATLIEVIYNEAKGQETGVEGEERRVPLV